MPGMAAPKSYAIPLCSRHKTKMQRNDQGAWMCFTCADEWLEGHVDAVTGNKSLGGVVLPGRTRDERKKTPSFRDVMPNRATRRAARRGK